MGPRTRPNQACFPAFGVSAVYVPLFSGRAALPRNRHRAGSLFQALSFPVPLYATHGAGSDMRGPGTAGGPVARIMVFRSVLYPKAARPDKIGIRAKVKERSS